MPPAPEPNALTPDGVQQLARSFQGCRVLLTAYELDLFTAVSQGARTSSLVADRLGTDARATDRLLNALCGLGLLTKVDGAFANTETAAACLVRGRPGYLSGLGHTAHLWHTWSGLTQAVRTGRAFGSGPSGPTEADWRPAFIEAMHARACATAPKLVNLLDLEGVSRVLDVGGGSGIYSMAFVRARPEIRATVYDLPEVVPLTRGYVEQEGLSDRIDTAPGDYLTDALPAGFDLVFLSAIVHSNSGEQNAALIGKCAAALNPGGQVIVVDFIMEEDRSRPAHGAMFALNMLVATEAGDTFTESEVNAWMRAAGLRRIRRQNTAFGTGIMSGRRPVD